jgi:hypothetical protein
MIVCRFVGDLLDDVDDGLSGAGVLGVHYHHAIILRDENGGCRPGRDALIEDRNLVDTRPDPFDLQLNRRGRASAASA